MDPLLDQISGIAESSAGSETQPFRIVILYENIVSAARALRACEILQGEIPAEIQLEIGVWKMDGLSALESRQRSAEAAAGADVLIIAASGTEERPAHFPAWVDTWLARSGTTGTALFTLLGDHATPGAASFASWLQEIASNNGIDSFSHPSLDGFECAPLRDIPLLMPARDLTGASGIPVEEWRPGAAATAASEERASGIIEHFDAPLRSRLQELRLSAAGVAHQEKSDALPC